MKNNESTIIRTELATWCILGACMLPYPIFLIESVFKHPAQFQWAPSLLAIFLLTVYIYMCGFRIKMSNSGFTFLRPFFPSAKIDWKDISRVETGFKWSSNRGPYYLKIFDERSEEILAINIKPFSRKGLAKFAVRLKKDAPHAKLDKATERLAQLKVPSLLDK